MSGEIEQSYGKQNKKKKLTQHKHFPVFFLNTKLISLEQTQQKHLMNPKQLKL